MELSEVVNPHFAFPVVGVVICAVLVFAFGFKSPVQPPSFDFIPEERRARKIKQKKKTQSNGHVVTVENPSPSARQPVAKALPQTNKVEKAESLKTKTKKHSRTSKQLPQADVVNETPKEVTDDGEWKTALSKKVKKMRSKHTEEPKGKEEAVKPELAASLSSEADVPQEQRPKKASPRLKKEASNASKKGIAGAAHIEKDQLLVKDSPPAMSERSALQVAPSPSPELSQETKEVSKDTTEASKKAPEVAKMMPEVSKKTTEAPKKSPQKAKKKAKSPEVTPQRKVQESAKIDTPNSAPVVVAKTEVLASESVSQTPVLGQFTEVQSPKSKKKKSKESREHYPECGSVPEASPGASQEDASSKNILATKQDGASSDSQSQKQSVSKGAATDPVSESSTSASASKPAATEQAAGTPNLVFDDMGGWEDAKPVKRKRKARREN